MREILFRGKCGYNNEWVEGFYYQAKWNRSDKELCHYITIPHPESYGQPSDHIMVHPETVGQFTGLTDKNGKKIFEGDIVTQNWYDHDEPSDDSFGEVVFCEYDCSFSVMDVEKDGIVPLGRCHAYHWECVVIGNIHDNPELLEVE